MNVNQQPTRGVWWVISNACSVVVLCYWVAILGGVVGDFRDISTTSRVLRETKAFAQLPRVTEREVHAFVGRRFRERGLERFLESAQAKVAAYPVQDCLLIRLAPTTAE